MLYVMTFIVDVRTVKPGQSEIDWANEVFGPLQWGLLVGLEDQGTYKLHIRTHTHSHICCNSLLVRVPACF